jgi:hypothetical protein
MEYTRKVEESSDSRGRIYVIHVLNEAGEEVGYDSVIIQGTSADVLKAVDEVATNVGENNDRILAEKQAMAAETQQKKLEAQAIIAELAAEFSEPKPVKKVVKADAEESKEIIP